MIETRPQKTQERALLIGLEKEGVSKWDLQDSLAELRELANSAGAQVIDTVTQKLQKPTAPYYIGRGKAESIAHSSSSIFSRSAPGAAKAACKSSWPSCNISCRV